MVLQPPYDTSLRTANTFKPTLHRPGSMRSLCCSSTGRPQWFGWDLLWHGWCYFSLGSSSVGCYASSISPILGWSSDWSRAVLHKVRCVVAGMRSGPCAFGRLTCLVHNLVDNGLKPYGVWVECILDWSYGSHRFCCRRGLQ
jgi:hypothetical protein